MDCGSPRRGVGGDAGARFGKPCVAAAANSCKDYGAIAAVNHKMNGDMAEDEAKYSLDEKAVSLRTDVVI
jgi:hypothetical protein